jgi:hypothetical protein
VSALVWAERVAGPHPVEPLPGHHGTRTWGFGPYVVRAHGPGRGYQQERAAAAFVGGPRVVACDDASRWLLIDRVPGRDAGPDDWRAGGAALRRLHTTPWIDDDPVPVADAWARRVAAARAAVPEAGVGADGLTGARVPCHRDAGPYNWRVDDDGAVRLVDWEHARADHPAVDLAAVVGLAHPDDPHVRAFLDGYGASPDEEAWLPAAVSLRALGAIAWARRRRDAAWEADGWAMLRRWTVGS